MECFAMVRARDGDAAELLEKEKATIQGSWRTRGSQGPTDDVSGVAGPDGGVGLSLSRRSNASIRAFTASAPRL